MYNKLLCLGTSEQYGISTCEQIKLFKQIGFEGFFTHYDTRLTEYAAAAEKIGMIYQSVHAPFRNSAVMWQCGEAAENAVRELKECAEACGRAGVGIMVCHTYIGFGKHCEVTECGIDNYRRIVEAAAENGVKIAFENTEGDEFLDVLMNALGEYDNVGFCWDSGHEQCYNHGHDMLSLYGKKLIATHLNDNVGIGDRNGNITWLDDLHLLPFDGVTDWDSAARKLVKYGYGGILTFELNKTNKPGRHTNDIYEKMSNEEYLAQAYVRACRFATLVKKYEAEL